MLFKRMTTYRVTPDREEWVAPEETLIDAGSALSDVEVPVGDGVFRVFSVFGICVSVVLFGAVVWLTTVRHDSLSQLSLRNRTVNVTVPPPRGSIMDRTGIPLVENVPSFDLLVISRKTERDDAGALRGVRQLAETLQRTAEELALELEDNIRQNAVFFAATDLSRSQVLALNSALPPGFFIITNTKRRYIDGEQFSQVVGYVGKVSPSDMAEDSYYVPSDTIGKAGIEAYYENTLRGSHGQLMYDASHAIVGYPATSGKNVVLSLDVAAQKALWNAVWDILRESGLSAASAIAQNPNDGSVLAMASFPSYDNNMFTGARLSPDDFSKLFNSTSRPLFNRVISGRYNPGSTIKPFIGMSALQENLMRAEQVVANECVSISIPNPLDPSNPYVFKNWRADTGPFNLYRAIADSCNVYFFTIGGGYGSFGGLGIDRIATYLRNAYADKLLGIDLPGEESGFLPTPDWKYSVKKEPWYQGDTYNVSIGQGDLLVTPLWINSYMSAIANGGTMWRPRVASRIVDEQNATLEVVEARKLGELPFSADVIRQMQTALRRTVTDGTAKILKDLPVSAAAKTGTAEIIKGQRINSLLTVYAPAENPQIALTILIEGSSSNQGYALRAARNFLGWYFGPSRTSPAKLQ